MTTTSTRAPLSPTPRTTANRGRQRVVLDRAALTSVLDDALVCHLGITLPDGQPLVLPTAFGYDLDGPDEGGSLYVHGSSASRMLGLGAGATVCVSLTVLDGLVAARSAFHHSMNYRSAVVIGEARVVDDPAEKAHALNLVVDHMIPGRTETLRPHTRKEVAATAVLAVPLHEASVKARSGPPVDEPEDVAAGTWGGHIPVTLVAGAVVTDELTGGVVPPEVHQRAVALGPVP